jgi:uncharacterized coiled-coil DUF342 family protein
MPEKGKAPYVTRADIEEFLRLEAERKSIQRQVDALERLAKPLKTKLSEYVRLEGGSDKTVERSGYVLAFKTKAGQISWRGEFERVAGISEAERIAANPPVKEYLSVEKAG